GVLALTAEGSETRVNSNTSGTQFNSPAEKVAMDANGNFVVIWQQSTSSYLAQRYAADGTTQGSAFSIGGADAIAMAADGRFVIAWSTGDGTGFQRYAADGTAQGSAVTFGDSS